MSDITVSAFAENEGAPARARIANVASKAVFGSLLALVVTSAIPYGTAEPWWKAAFVGATFTICILALLESLLRGDTRIYGSRSILLSMLALCVLALLQTISIRTTANDFIGENLNPWNSISADPYETRFFVLELLSLTTCLALLYRYARTRRRINLLIHVIIVVAVISALFGLVRQNLHQQVGFLLPRTMPGQGYGQFINKNHFAVLMEMAFGLGLGLCLFGSHTRERAMFYVALLLPIWTGLVLSNSRGGILAMLAQIMVASLLLTGGTRSRAGFVSGVPASAIRSPIIRIGLLLCLLSLLLIGTVWVGGDRLVDTFGAASTELNPNANGLRQGATRNEIWRASLRMFAAHPIVGVGFGGYWVAITAYHDASGVMTPQQAHNDYLELLDSGGLVGFAIGVWFTVSLFQRARANLYSPSRFQRSIGLAAILGITGVAVHSLVDFGLHLLVNALVFVVLVMLVTYQPHVGEDRFEF